jgi:hypothetical protein
MVSTVRSISNHYETLRVKTTASSDEISEAFSKQIRSARVRPDITVAQLAQISVAYETLRDPIRRSAYDESLGLNAKPVQPVTPAPSSAAPPTQSQVGSFIASSLREPAKPRETRPQPDPVPQWPVPKAAAQARPQPEPVRQAAPQQRPRVELVLEPAQERRALSFGRKEATIGAGLAGVAILAIALMRPQEAAPELASQPAATHAVTVGLPPAAPAEAQSEPSQISGTPRLANASPISALPVPQPALESAKSTAETPPTAAQSTDQSKTSETAKDQPVQSAPTQTAPEQTAAAATQAPAAQTPADATTDAATVAIPASARLPLADETIARTIGRIGYACGSIVSSSAVSQGVFKITCSSGDSYQASPVNGRYHFRRWGSH